MPASSAADRRRVRATSWIQAFLGVVVFLSPFLSAPADYLWWHWNAWTVGVLVVGLAILAAVPSNERTQGALAGGSLHLLLGLWLVLAAVLAGAETVFFVLTVVLGSVVAAVAAYNTRVGIGDAERKTA